MNESSCWQPEARYRQMGENLHKDYVGESVGKAFPRICGLS